MKVVRREAGRGGFHVGSTIRGDPVVNLASFKKHPLPPDADKNDERRPDPDSAWICLSLARALDSPRRTLNRQPPFNPELVAVHTAHLLDLNLACPLSLRYRGPRLRACVLPPPGAGLSRPRRRLCGQGP